MCGFVSINNAMSEVNLHTDLNLRAEIRLYYDLYIPENAKKYAPFLIAVHGYGAHKRYMMREARLVTPVDWVIASIQGPHQHFRVNGEGYRVGFGWLTDHRPEESVSLHHNFLLELIKKLAGEDIIDPERIFLYGFSQACALNFRFAFTNPDILRALVGICGGIPGDLETNPVYKLFAADTFYLYGDDDEFYTQEKLKGFEQKLRDRLPNFQSKQYNAKHEITDDMREDIKIFLSKERG